MKAPAGRHTGSKVCWQRELARPKGERDSRGWRPWLKCAAASRLGDRTIGANITERSRMIRDQIAATLRAGLEPSTAIEVPPGRRNLLMQRFKIDDRRGIENAFPQGGTSGGGDAVGKMSNVGRPAPSLARRAGVSTPRQADGTRASANRGPARHYRSAPHQKYMLGRKLAHEVQHFAPSW